MNPHWPGTVATVALGIATLTLIVCVAIYRWKERPR